MRLIFSLFLIFSLMFAENINLILNKIEKKDDLSNKTKMESEGISYVITRYQLDMMQVKTLADVLKNTVIGYSESRYGVLDPWNSPFIPYNSFGVRIFIDNQEVTTGQYDNALFLLGKIDLSFVDHIEIYYMSPSYSLTNEPAYVIIKLYTKKAQRDEGTRVEFDYGTFKTNIEALDFAKVFKDSLFFHLSRTELNHKLYNISSSVVSRNSIAKHFLLSIYNDTTQYLLTGVAYNQDAFLGLSLDGNIKTSQISSKLLHAGINKKIGKVTLKYTIDYSKDISEFEENNNSILYFNLLNQTPIYSTYTSDCSIVNTLRASYKNSYKKHRYILGASYRIKNMDFDKIKINNQEVDYTGEKKQNILTAFLEDNYQFLPNSIFSIGSSVSKYDSNVKEYFLKQFRIGNTYLYNKDNIFKIFFQHMEFLNGSYLLSTLVNSNAMKIRKTNIFIGKYKKIIKNDTLEFTYLLSKIKNVLILDENGQFTYTPDYRPVKVLDFRYHKSYNFINDFILELSRVYLKGFKIDRIDKVILLNTHRYKKFEFFENFIFRLTKYDTGDKITKKGYDVNLGVRYNVNDNLTFSLKANNIFNERYKNSYPLVNIYTQEIKTLDTPLIDREIIFSMEYMF